MPSSLPTRCTCRSNPIERNRLVELWGARGSEITLNGGDRFSHRIRPGLKFKRHVLNKTLAIFAGKELRMKVARAGQRAFGAHDGHLAVSGLES